jgi:hypothetical protein
MRKYILLLGVFLVACTALPPAPKDGSPAEISATQEYNAPNWDVDETVALINSKITTTNQRMLLTNMRSILDREAELYSERIRNLQDMINFCEESLRRDIEAYPETEGVPSPEEEENFVSYCATKLVQIELLKIQLFYKEELNRVRLSINRIVISLPKEQ